MANLSLFFALAAVLAFTVDAQTSTSISKNIRLDHFGYRPGDLAYALFSSPTSPGTINVISYPGGTTILSTTTKSSGPTDSLSGETMWEANISAITAAAGTYQVSVPSWQGTGNYLSYPFDVRADVYVNVGQAALKMYYWQRCGVAHVRLPFLSP